VLRTSVVHPEDFTFKLPEGVSLAEGAMVEPLAVGMHAANKAQIVPGDVAVVIGAGTIGMMTVLAALAGGCSRVIVSDVLQPKLDLAATLGPVTPVNVAREDLGPQGLAEAVREATAGWGADVVFEASGNERAAAGVFDLVCPGGRVVFIGMPGSPILYDVVAAQTKEARVEHVFRYAHVYPRALALMGSGAIDVKPLITDVFPFEEGIEAFEFASHMPPASVKAQIELSG
jgi:D-xylulose reductase